MDGRALKDEDIEIALLKEVPLSFAKGNAVLPVRRENGTLFGLVADDLGKLAMRELAVRYGLTPRTESMEREKVLELINRFYGQVGSAEEVMHRISGDDLSSVATEFERPRDILELTEEGPIIRLLNALLQQAVKERASDIHVEPYEKELEVRIRVDGVLRSVLSPPKIIQDALVSRVKIMANLDIAEKRLPQDGRIRLLVGGRDIDIRVSVVPTVHGERAVLRLLDRMQGILGLWEVGMEKVQEAAFEELLMRPDGIVLVTGPTGSGKTTTLYAALNRIHSEEKNIVTVEDPVEYQLKGIGQIPVNPRTGLTFARGLRSILRQDPDVILVGEIRDRETAEIAIQASLTGHLVLSTLHTTDSSSALTRLVDMGVEHFLVASSLSAVLAQRLARLICPHCKESYRPTAAESVYFASPPEALWRGSGCAKCNGTGYLGRLGIFELLVVDGEVRRMVSDLRDAPAIKAYAVSRGMRTLREDGLAKVLAGQTTLEEVLRTTQKDDAAL
ncbi:MAG: type II secretion system ATPase GspE [Nitrospirota bacterium]|jgi:general secretion pathway protein E